MFANNIENIHNFRKLHQLLFHFCQQDTFFKQYLNLSSDCKQCPGNLVLTLDCNYVSVQISMHTHYFNSCTQFFQMFLAFKFIITWHTLAKFLPMLLQYYQWNHLQLFVNHNNETWSHHHNFVMKIFSWKLQHSQTNFPKGVICSE